MIIDTLDNLTRYLTVCPNIQAVLDYLACHSLESLPDGKTVISGDDVWVNVETCGPRTKDEARIEAHRLMADIQIPLSGTETHGYSPLSSTQMDASDYDTRADISFLSVSPQMYFCIKPKEFVLYLPGEGHAPAITNEPLHKAVFKVKYLKKSNNYA